MAVGHYNTFTESFYTMEQCQHWLHRGRAAAINEETQLESMADLAMQEKRDILHIDAVQKDLQHWVFPGGHPSKY